MSLLANQRPRTATEIVDAGVQVCRAHAVPLLTIAGLVIIPPAVVDLFASGMLRSVMGIVENLLLNVGGGAASIYIAALMTEGEISVAEAFSRVPVGKVIAASIAFGIAVLLGLIAVVIPGVILLIRLWLATTVAAIERPENSNKALSRSWALTRGHGMHVFRTVLLSLGVALVVMIGVGIVVGMVTEPLHLDETLTDLLISPILMVVSAFVWSAMTFLYIDLRVRVEGADIEAMVAQLPDAGGGRRVPNP